jgi:DNA-binding transcriptional LysR family regulator
MSFTKAAAELCVTQGAVSQQVKQLEGWLQRPLFLRSPRALVLTPEGQWLASVVRESFQAIEGTLVQLRIPQAEGPLALSCAPSFAMGWLTPRLGDFYRSHPEIGLRVIGEFHALDRERMARDEVAAALRYDLGQYPDLLATEILDEWLLPVASPAFLAAHPQLRSPSDLRPALLLHDSSAWDGASPYEEWEHWLRHAGVTLQGFEQGHHFNLSQLAQGAALAGQGIAMGRMALVLEDLVSGRLVAPFGMPVRSRAAYHFVSPLQRTGRTEKVLSWLVAQAAHFRLQRDGLLQALTASGRLERP